MDITVQRNGFGRQVDSFEVDLPVAGIKSLFLLSLFELLMWRRLGEGVEVLATVDDKIVAAKQNQLLVSSFHPELTNDTRFLQLFIDHRRKERLTHKGPDLHTCFVSRMLSIF